MNKKLFQLVVKAEPRYLPEQSDPGNHQFIWAYEISIENQSEDIVQLLNRYWLITDMTGRVEEVRGAGVIGLQPIIKPGTRFVYTSYCQLNTPQGTMEGYYDMQNLEDARFRITIPKFILSAPSGITQSFRSRLH